MERTIRGVVELSGARGRRLVGWHAFKSTWMEAIVRGHKIFSLITLGLAIAGASTGCGSGRDRISSLVADPTHYLNRDVNLSGEVTEVHELPLGLTNIAAYRLNDGTGQIWVISRAGAPLRGDHVDLKGHVEEMGNLNLPVLGNVLGDVVQERDRRMR